MIVAPEQQEETGSFAVGSLVRARGREWTVLPDSTPGLLLLRPLGAAEAEVTALLPDLEDVESATFALPDAGDAERIGDHNAARLLRDALRLGFRASAGPFRSFGRLAVDPRPYQFVPLLVGLKLDPVRLLISDDVGVGKTVEAGLLVREMLDRGEVRRFAVLCPPQLAEQWQRELADKFHLDAELVLSGTASRLERRCLAGRGIFETFDHTIVSTDYIKGDARRAAFLETAPELIVVDEAHTCAFADANRRGGRQQRYALLRALADDPARHVVLLTATPHSGDEGAFRSLLSFLDKGFESLPADLSGKENEGERRRLARHMVQRRRGDVRHFMRESEGDTPFPDREEREESYELSPPHRVLFGNVLDYAREAVEDDSGGRRGQRVRWWSILALLRALSSSPAAAAATLRNRAVTADAETADDADAAGRRAVLDLIEDESAEGIDAAPGAADDPEGTQAKRLRTFAKEADALVQAGAKNDNKLRLVTAQVSDLLKDGFNPIVFCRFIDTAEYVGQHLRDQLKKAEVAVVTGRIPPAEREAAVAAMPIDTPRVLVCTDCLSEGVNLQHSFNAVVHYDLSWNPTRHEQREGRVDRFGQKSPHVRVLSVFGTDNQIDGVVLDVLIRKHKRIRRDLGVAVPVPVDTEQVIEALFEGLLLRRGGGKGDGRDQLRLFDDERVQTATRRVHDAWDNVTEREKRTRTVFAQESVKPDEVARELAAAREATGGGVDLPRFVRDALLAHGAAEVSPLVFDLAELSRRHPGLRDAISLAFNGDVPDPLRLAFTPPADEGMTLLTRTHPLVEKLAAHVLDAALDDGREPEQAVAKRLGAIRTNAVTRRVVLVLLRLRFQIHAGDEGSPLLAEDCRVVGFEGDVPLPAARVEELLAVAPDSNLPRPQAQQALALTLDGFDALRPHLEVAAKERAEELREAHVRVRESSRVRGERLGEVVVEPKLPPDVLGVYVYLPVPKL